MIDLRTLIRDPRVAFAVVGLALVLVGYRIFQKPPSPDAAAADSNAGPAVAVTGGVGGSSRGAGPQRLSDPALPAAPAAWLVPEVAWSWDRNPFLETESVERIHSPISSGQPVTPSETGGQKPASSDSRMGFHGTVISEDQAVAIFGDRTVLEGGRVGEWTLEKIAPYRVSVRRGSENRILETCQPLARYRAEDNGEKP